jgi:hypothetical protein
MNIVFDETTTNILAEFEKTQKDFLVIQDFYSTKEIVEYLYRL